jgi:hypothetical protein
LDTKLTWKDHIIKKRKQMDIRHKELYWLLGRKSNLSIDNKLLLYKPIFTPIWTYGIELWGCASKSNIAVIQRCQSNILRAIVNAPWYVTNDMIHKDLGMPTVQEVIHERSIKHRTKLASHPNPLLQPLPRDDVIRKTAASWPVTRSTRFPRWRCSHHASKSPASTLPYRILCILTADLINIYLKKRKKG